MCVRAKSFEQAIESCTLNFSLYCKWLFANKIDLLCVYAYNYNQVAFKYLHSCIETTEVRY